MSTQYSLSNSADPCSKSEIASAGKLSADGVTCVYSNPSVFVKNESTVARIFIPSQMFEEDV